MIKNNLPPLMGVASVAKKTTIQKQNFKTLFETIWVPQIMIRIMAFSWSILMSPIVTFSNVWDILLKECKGAGGTTVIVLLAGMVVLIFSLIFANIF